MKKAIKKAPKADNLNFITYKQCDKCKVRFPLYYKAKGIPDNKRVRSEKEIIKIAEILLDALNDYDHKDTEHFDCAEQAGCEKCIKRDHCVGITEPLERLLYRLKYGIINRRCDNCVHADAKETV